MRLHSNGPFSLWPPDLPERLSITATLIDSSGSPEAVRLVPGPLRAIPRGYPRRLWAPSQAPLPCSTGDPVANSALLAVFPQWVSLLE